MKYINCSGCRDGWCCENSVQCVPDAMLVEEPENHTVYGPHPPCGNVYCVSGKPAIHQCSDCYLHYCEDHIVQYSHDNYCWPCLGDCDYSPAS